MDPNTENQRLLKSASISSENPETLSPARNPLMTLSEVGKSLMKSAAML